MTQQDALTLQERLRMATEILQKVNAANEKRDIELCPICFGFGKCLPGCELGNFLKEQANDPH